MRKLSVRRKQTISFCGSSWDRKAKVAENHKFMENETEMEDQDHGK